MSVEEKPFSAPLKVAGDDRGVFVQFLQNTHELQEKVGMTIKRFYYVYNYGKGVIRGFHYHKEEWKYFTIVSGAAKFVALDPDHPELKYTFVSSARMPNLIVVPPGYANAWMSLEDSTVLTCGSTATLEESIKDDRRYDPYTWGDLWTVKGR